MAGKNRLLCEIENFLQDFIRYTIEESAVSMEKQQNSLAGHYAILNAIQAKDPDLAANVMKQHLTYCRELY